MAITNIDRLRQLLGENIPEGGTEDDTMFSDEQIEDFLNQGNSDIDASAYYGWKAKMAELANLVNVTEGNSSREMGELHKAAKRMTDMYAGFAPTSGRGRVKVGRIRRRGRGEVWPL